MLPGWNHAYPNALHTPKPKKQATISNEICRHNSHNITKREIEDASAKK